MQQVMREASRIVLDGFELRADAHVVKYPDRYMDERGEVMWGRVMALMDQIEPS
jgi:DNA polymerase-1